MSILSKKRCGLEITDNSVSFLKLAGKETAATVQVFGREKLAAGVVKDGTVLKKKELIKALQNLFLKAKPKPAEIDEVVFPITEDKSYLGTFIIQDPEKKIEENLSSQVVLRFPFKTENLYSDYKFFELEKEKYFVIYVAVEKKIIDSYLEVFDAVDIEPVSIEFQSQASMRALFGELEEKSCYLVADIGDKNTVISLVDHFGVRYSTLLNFGKISFVNEIVSTFKVTEKEALKLVKKHGMTLAKNKRTKARVLAEVVNHAIINFKDAISYAEDEMEKEIKAITLCGELAGIPYLSSYIKEQLSVDVVVSNHLSKIKKGKNIIRGKVISPSLVGASLKALDKKFDQEINLVTD